MRTLPALLLASLLAGCVGGRDADAPDRAPTACPPPSWSELPVTPPGESASEVSLAIDPTDPQHLVAAANSGGGFGVYTSRDGGANWTAELLSALDLLPEGRFMAAGVSLSDPAVAFGPDGTVHIAGLAYIPGSAVVVFSRAGDDAPWTSSTVWQSEVAATFNDKEWLAVDPASGTMLVAWQREPAMDSLRTVDETTGLTDADLGVIVTSRSTDGGASWSLPVVASESLHNNGTQVAWIGGVAHLVWVDYERPGLQHAVSTDGGASWGEPEDVADLRIVKAFPAFGRMHTLPALASDGKGLAVVWHDARNDAADVLVSLWDGAGWSAPERVPDDAALVQFYPWAAYDGAGVLHVGHYSGDGADANFTYRHAARAPDGAWSVPEDLSAPFQVFGNATAGASDIGDYTAVAALGGRVHAAWAQPDPVEAGSLVHVGSLRPVSC